MSLRDRVKQRVEELQTSPITLARSVGLERGYINDIIIGRKKSVRDARLQLVAKALRCDPEYLTGDQDVPRLAVSGPGITVLGVCQTGVWRSKDTPPDYPETVPVGPDVRYPHLNQGAYLLRGIGPPQAGGCIMAAIAVEPTTYQRNVRSIDEGSVVVVERQRDDLVELSIRVVQGTGNERSFVGLLEDVADPPPLLFDDNLASRGVTLLGVVTSIVKIYS